MPIDTSIYNALIRPKSVGDYLAEYDERDLRDQQRQANALALQSGRQKQADYEREQQEYGLVQNLLAGLGGDASDDQRANALYGTGTRYGMTQAEAIRKAAMERQKAEVEAQAKRAEVASKNAGTLKQYATILTQRPTQATAMALLNHWETATGERADNIRDILAKAGDDPEALTRIAFALSTEADNLRPKTEISDLGGTKQAFTTDFLGRVTPGQSFQKTATPGERLTAGTAAERLKFDRDRLTEDKRQFDAPKPGAAPSPASAKVLDAQEAIAIINQAEPLLAGATGGYLGTVIDTIAQVFSASTPGAINAQQLKALEGALVAKMPKMSGPQSDKDVALYRQMAAAIGDTTVPYPQKAAALQTVRDIQERYAGMTPGSSKPAKPAAPNAAPAPQDGGVVDWGSLK